jgi:hypothetical protein
MIFRGATKLPVGKRQRSHPLGPLPYFAADGNQIIRIQAREDGPAIDQVVRSAERYLTKAPKQTKNDTTIVERVRSALRRP